MYIYISCGMYIICDKKIFVESSRPLVLNCLQNWYGDGQQMIEEKHLNVFFWGGTVRDLTWKAPLARRQPGQEAHQRREAELRRSSAQRNE